jgi:Stigma-specific protein, Stig1
MNARRWLACLALLGLPACLDSIVGTECATGYSPCHGVCVAAGTCAAVDAASEDAAAIDTTVDGGSIDGSESIDTAIWETTTEAGTLAEAPAVDSEPVDAKGSKDVPVQDDAPDDAPALDDTGPPPFLAVDSAQDQDEAIDAGAPVDGPPCADCVDAEGVESGNTDDGGASDVSSDDVSSDDADNSGALDGALVCADPQVICNDQCVDISQDPENCGDCNKICASGVCLVGSCLVCQAEESVCGQECVNLATDPDNCGSCGTPCTNGLCSSGQCEAAGTGHAIVIGHDYLKNRPDINRVLGNAVFLWPVNPVRLLVYEGSANATAIAGANAAIAQVAGATGRQSVRTAAAAADVPNLLASTDVFLIYGQELANDATLLQLGSDWSAALVAFVNSGGTVVVLDGAYPGNSGTCQILAQAIPFQIARGVSVTGDACTVVARGDALATGLPKTYLCEKNSTSFVVTDSSANVMPVVQDVDQTVVVRKLF